MLRLEKETARTGIRRVLRFPSLPWERIKLSFLAVVLAMVVGVFLILFMGKNPLLAYSALWQGSFGSLDNLAEFTVCTTPLLFTGLSVAVAFRTGLFNIGAEGQFIMGQIGAAWAGYYFAGLPTFVHLPLALLVGMVAGGIWGGVPGYLKAKLKVHEVINTIMMNYVALYFTHYLVMGPLRGHDFLPVTKAVAPTAELWRFGTTRANIGFVLALLAAWLVYWFLWRTTLGYEARAVGFNPQAAEYAGINVPRRMVMAMVLSGALAGLGGAVQVLGVQHRFYDVFTFTGYGFDGIAVALLGSNHPAGVVVGAALFGFLNRGAMVMQSMAEIPKEIINIVTAIVIILVAGEEMARFLLGRKRKVIPDVHH